MQELDVLIPGVTVYQDIIEEHNETLVQQVGEGIIHHLYKCCRGIGEAHRQDHSLVQAITSVKGGLRHAVLCHATLPVLTAKTQRSRVLCTSKSIHEIFVSWQWVRVFNNDLVKGPVVHAKT